MVQTQCAGVINYALKDDYEGSEVNLSYGDAEGTLVTIKLTCLVHYRLLFK